VIPPAVFDQYGTAVVDATGSATVKLRTNGSGVAWRITVMSVSVNSAVKQPNANVYINDFFVEGSQSGSGDASTGTDHIIGPTDVIKCVWTGADVGATATFRVSGWMYAGGLSQVTP
jgi:hypothetical protein